MRPLAAWMAIRSFTEHGSGKRLYLCDGLPYGDLGTGTARFPRFFPRCPQKIICYYRDTKFPGFHYSFPPLPLELPVGSPVAEGIVKTEQLQHTRTQRARREIIPGSQRINAGGTRSNSLTAGFNSVFSVFSVVKNGCSFSLKLSFGAERQQPRERRSARTTGSPA